MAERGLQVCPVASDLRSSYSRRLKLTLLLYSGMWDIVLSRRMLSTFRRNLLSPSSRWKINSAGKRVYRHAKIRKWVTSGPMGESVILFSRPRKRLETVSPKFCYSWRLSDRLCLPPSILSNGCPTALSPGVKRPGCEADHSPPPSAVVKNCKVCRLEIAPYAIQNPVYKSGAKTTKTLPKQILV
jgi:hypothetical protein